MTTKIGVEIHANGDENDFILKLVANHNEGLCSASQRALYGYLSVRDWIFPSRMITYVGFKSDGVVRIYEKGKHTLTLTWKEVHELNVPACNENDIKDLNI